MSLQRESLQPLQKKSSKRHEMQSQQFACKPVGSSERFKDGRGREDLKVQVRQCIILSTTKAPDISSAETTPQKQELWILALQSSKLNNQLTSARMGEKIKKGNFRSRLASISLSASPLQPNFAPWHQPAMPRGCWGCTGRLHPFCSFPSVQF